MWLEVRFRPHGGGRWFPDTWRGFCAKVLGAHRRLFWRDEGGQPLGGKPLITFVGSARWCGIRVVGKQGQQQFSRDCVTVLGSVLSIAQALDAQYGGQHIPDILEGKREVAVGYTRYHIRKLGLPRSYCRRNRDTLIALLNKKASQERGDDWIRLVKDAKSIILDSLREEFPEASIGWFKWAGEPRLSAPVNVGGELVFCLTDLHFSLPVRIAGPVQVGSLQSWGYGDIHQIPLVGKK